MDLINLMSFQTCWESTYKSGMLVYSFSVVRVKAWVLTVSRYEVSVAAQVNLPVTDRCNLQMLWATLFLDHPVYEVSE